MALKSLRYLGTPEAAREMARLFRSSDNNTEFECMFGLVGSPSRADVAEGKLAGLLFRYADGSVLPFVLPKITESVGSWACEPQRNALAYVLKVDEVSARPLIDHALAARAQTGCWHSVLMEVGTLHPSPVLEEFAVKALYDPDAQLGADAANYLARYGSEKARPKLWERYVDWSRIWKGRDAELRFNPAGPQTHVWDANLGQALARALASGEGWFTDEQQLRQIRSLATESIEHEMDADLREALKQPIEIQYTGFTPPQFRLAQYELHSLDGLKAKLKQFPGSTSFVFSGPVQAKGVSLISDLKTWLKDTHIKISGFDSALVPY
ncbi:MAG: hypothetical protein M3Y27_29855 [Acidobacteriota bacterium]|nr:hypothetical protein [Acidobacteriota bacterium]